MKQLEIFYLSRCPYCRNAIKAIEELRGENPAYSDINIRWIEESEEPALADSRDYYNVPAVFFNGEKLYEAKPFHDYDTIKAGIRGAFDAALS